MNTITPAKHAAQGRHANVPMQASVVAHGQHMHADPTNSDSVHEVLSFELEQMHASGGHSGHVGRCSSDLSLHDEHLKILEIF